MALFSRRTGILPMHKTMQYKSIDADLRNGLWNSIDQALFSRWYIGRYDTPGPETAQVDKVYRLIWSEYFKYTLDTCPSFRKAHGSSGYVDIRQRFFECEWYELLDLLEFVLACEHNLWAKLLRSECNRILERENSAYRVVGLQFAEITSEIEMECVDDALKSSAGPSRQHIAAALEMLSRRDDPDYRNSIKESISAVESAFRGFLGDEQATLGRCLTRMKSKFDMHPALADGLSKLYGYTSDKDGIRHGLTDNSRNPTFEEAKLMLVLCSAFANFVVGVSAHRQ